jgi:hypothetical protein
MPTRARSKNFLGSIGARGFRVAICVRPERGNRIYFHLPRKKRSPKGSRGGSLKIASDLEYDVPGAERRKNEAEAELRAARIALALRDGASAEEIEEIARGGSPDAVVPDGQLRAEVPVAEDAALASTSIQAAPAAADVLTSSKRPAAILPLAGVLKLAIGPSPRGIPGKARARRMAFWAENPPPKSGIYDCGWTLQARTARALADKIEDMLGAERDLMTITSNDTGLLWQVGVSDNAVNRVSVLLRVSQWAERQYGTSHQYRALSMPQGWKKKLRAVTASPEKCISDEPRYSVSETGRMWRVLMDPESPVHPVLRSAALLGGEHRLGQVLNTTVHHVARAGAAWVFKPPEAGKKLTSWILVPLPFMERFQELVEAAAQRSDGRLFPLTRGPALQEWREVERLANVTPYGWYAMRRAMTDICDTAITELRNDTCEPLEVSGELVLDAISGHRSKSVRDAYYRNSPVGVLTRPKQGTGMFDVLVSAMRVVRRARELAIERADCPI